jgi:hypothetical protein
MGKVEILVELGCDPDASDLDAPVVRGCMLNEIRLLSILEVEREVFEESGLISFDGEMVVGLAPDQIGGYRALGKKGIGSDVLAPDVDGVEQGDGCLDLVCLLELFIALYRQSSHFFWV